MKKRHGYRQNKSPKSEIKRLDDAIKRESDNVERESLRQHKEHWIRTLQSSN